MEKFELIKNKSVDEYMEGAHCAEVIFKNVTKAWQPDFDENLVRIANPFGGGIADCGDVCGALVGGLMVIGYLFGRKSFKESQDFCWQLSQQYHNRFRKELCATTCYEIRGRIFNWDTHVKCAETVKRAIDILWDLLSDAERMGKVNWQH